MEPKKLTLDEQLCFALYSATNAVIRSYRPRLQQLGLTYPQYLVMLTLWQDGSRQIGHIAGRLNLPANAITPMLDRLEKAGLIERDRDADDRRVVHIRLTQVGAELEAQASLAQQNVVCDTELAPSALIELRDDLKALVSRMEPDGIVQAEITAGGAG